MSSNIKIKRSDTSGNPAVLGAGELAYSGLTDNGSNGGDRLYIGTGVETSGNAVNHLVIGGKYFTDIIIAASNLSSPSSLVKRDSSSNFSANNITANLIGNASSSTKLGIARTISITGDISYASPEFDGTANITAVATLSTVNSSIGTYGSTTSIPIVTVNAKGLITSVSTASISSNLLIAGTTGSDSISVGTDTLTFAGGTGVITTVTDNQVSFAIGQEVSTTSNVTFNDTVISGNLTVNGTTTTINATNLAVTDLNITVAKDAIDAASANGAGLTVNGPLIPATLLYSSGDDRWNLNKSLTVDTVYGALSGNATTATAWATARDLSLTGDGTATLSSVSGAAAVSAALTLATVNSNVGSFGNGTSIPNFTVNGKGLVTAVSTTIIPTATSSVLGLAKFDSSDFLVTSGVVTIATLDGGTY